MVAQELRELRLEAAGARRREASLKDAHAARIAQLEREIQKLKPAALHAKDLEARLADREQRVQKLRAEVPFLSPTCEGHACVMLEGLPAIDCLLRTSTLSCHTLLRRCSGCTSC